MILEYNFVDLKFCLFCHYEIIINASKIAINGNKIDRQNFIQMRTTFFGLILYEYVYVYTIQYNTLQCNVM